MTVKIRVPILPESVSDAVVVKWYKQQGDSVIQDESLVDLETDKIVLEVPAPKSGILKERMIQEGSTVKTGEVLATVEEENENNANAEEDEDEDEKDVSIQSIQESIQESVQEEKKEVGSNESRTESDTKIRKQLSDKSKRSISPTIRRLISEKGFDWKKFLENWEGDRFVVKKDVEDRLKSQTDTDSRSSKKETVRDREEKRTEKRMPLSRIRQRIAERLVRIQHEAALLTTFNEIDMKLVVNLRKKYCDEFEKRHGVRLGLMSFFTKSVIEALKRFPTVNASIDGNEIIYHNYYDIGIAIDTKRGLVVPILRNAENMNIAGIEKKIREYASRAQEGYLNIGELTGGTFTISNGGTYGSLLSTPIINLPQTAILGMHKIEDRPTVKKGKIVIRPIMSVALSYDHRVIDGREAILFLVTIKRFLEDPSRLLLEI
ncbi:2-oxoglutarate dehydrogenase complex dihydrolipoyllysine-residue succinyltransferase [Coxiella endosymbiont of Amblyomma sculptum]|uniref:2-oxoglutarate dehydrogenase complex dihydrolipoyllysine-residue succinyltransferase n=1 Tax=Coxiella endosymbiont of Amblyomma sculptum TaxID=2487929 RepID=UPI00132ED239|nr:2-oxoglutarate dehydrogenase complex dihydrolipoyllysine-residue succinyltransferase [Coxiella endosymbiont of Amblyomma sculptum]QHG92330.1 2-oxoglutarate dehydrogenase complex dihydrolipoyllysine-residue succinyltransferase [Coxiella endosymbiont of Amblyomma sculptum]